MTESSTNPRIVGLLRRVQNTQAFLKMAVVELRRIAEQSPDIAGEFRHMAQKLEAEAADLALGD